LHPHYPTSSWQPVWVISLISTNFLAGPLIIKATGSLLRIGDRKPCNVKIAIFRTLGQFQVSPPLPRSFVRSLSSSACGYGGEWRLFGMSIGLSHLSKRVDPLWKELVGGCSLEESQQFECRHCRCCGQKGGSKAKLPKYTVPQTDFP
jgi:hypothetical protein